MEEATHGPPAEPPRDVHGIRTVAPEMERVFTLVERVARNDVPVLVRGETGAGKELVARAIHRLSARRDRPFMAINCATLTPELLASELFGHVKGAFTGAVRSRRGLFSLADGGTIFLDEIGEMPLDIQARLLRVVEEQRFYPLGGSEQVYVDVRLVSATHRALRAAVAERRFRADLMYRIRVVPLFLPRLAERTGDVEALAWHFVRARNPSADRTVEAIADSARQALVAYDWPGNVRELENVVEHAFAVGEGPVLTLDELTPELRGEMPVDADHDEPHAEDPERRRLAAALAEAKGVRSEAARRLGISRSTLWRRLKRHGLA